VDTRPLGGSGLVVSRLALGTMTWGDPSPSGTGPDEAAAQLTGFRDAGGTLVDTGSSVVADGTAAEDLLGTLLAATGGRESVVLSTRSGAPTSLGSGASRRHLLTALDASLDRLRTDHVDLWQVAVHDPAVPLAETLAALDEAVSSGRARYVGVDGTTGWQTAAAATWQRAWPARQPVVSVSVEHSLLARGVEREVVPAALASGLGLLPWSPLGRGVLTGKYRRGTPADARGAAAPWDAFVAPYLTEPATRIVDAVLTAADGLGVSPVAVALAWVRDRPGVAAPVVGARTAAQLQAALEAEALTLPTEIRSALDDVSAPLLSYPEVPPAGLPARHSP